MKKTIFTIILLLCFVFAFSACGGESAKDGEKFQSVPTAKTADAEAPLIAPPEKNVIFAPLETPTERNAELFWEYIDNLEGMTEYFSEARETTVVYNYAPDEIIDEYGFNAFAIKNLSEDAKGGSDTTSYCEYYNGTLYPLYYFMPDQNINGYVHFAISDLNGDGFGEVYTSYNAYRFSESSPMNRSDVYVFDSGLSAWKCYYEYKRTTYFKEDATGKLAVYKTDTDSYMREPIELANTLSDPLTVNTARYSFDKPTFEVECSRFRATVTFDEADIGFPVLLKQTGNSFKATVSMTYLGESFDYVHTDGYKEGAEVRFFNDDSEIKHSPWAAAAVMSHFFVENGEVITREYDFTINADSVVSAGAYNAEVSYRGTIAPVAENVFTISR